MRGAGERLRELVLNWCPDRISLSSVVSWAMSEKRDTAHAEVLSSAGALPLNDIAGWRVGESEDWSASSLREANWFEFTKERGELACICGGVRDSPSAWDNVIVSESSAGGED